MITDKVRTNMLVSITGDLLEVGTSGEVTLDDINRVNEVVRDALAEAPQTELGRKAKAVLAEELEKGEQSKYYQVEFDFNVHLNEVVLPQINFLLNLLGESEGLVSPFGASAEEEDAKNKLVDGISHKLLMNMKDITPLGYYPDVFKRIKQLLDQIEHSVVSQVQGHREEVFARQLGARNPKYKRFDQAHATYAQLLTLLEKARKETGNVASDYFPD